MPVGYVFQILGKGVCFKPPTPPWAALERPIMDSVSKLFKNAWKYVLTGAIFIEHGSCLSEPQTF